MKPEIVYFVKNLPCDGAETRSCNSVSLAGRRRTHVQQAYILRLAIIARRTTAMRVTWSGASMRKELKHFTVKPNISVSTAGCCVSLYHIDLTFNIPSLGRQRCLPSWGPRRTPWFFCNFSTVWWGRVLKLCFLGFWNYNSVIQALLVSNILCLFISTEVSQ